MNRYATETATHIELLRIDPDVERRQIERLVTLRTRRHQARWQTSLNAVRAAASTTDNLVPLIIDAVEAHATVGEIADALRDVFGEHQDADAGRLT